MVYIFPTDIKLVRNIIIFNIINYHVTRYEFMISLHQYHK
jgi:hypothetical protein